MGKIKDYIVKFKPSIVLSGEIFGRLTIVSEVASRKKHRAFLCRCACGNTREVTLCNLRTGHTQSCGCFLAEVVKTVCVTHGMAGKDTSGRTYRIWSNIKTRCLNQKSPAYKDYGGRGITICDHWKDSFQNFFNDMGECPPGMSIERKDNNLGYSKDNCKWATSKQQANNRRSSAVVEFGSERHTIAEWAEITGILRDTIEHRLRSGWTPKDALQTPTRKCNRNQSEKVSQSKLP
jgi:hypothetical protein